MGIDPRTHDTLVTLVGPTAVGKTAMAIPLAQALSCEILSADSRQFYRELSIGTAKPSDLELAQVPHHFINSHSIQDNFTAGDYEKAALSTLERLFREDRCALLVGGSGLFVNAVLHGLDKLPKPAAGIRERLNQSHIEQGLTHLQQRLKQVDPAYFKEVDIQNPQRVIRALEVYESSGVPYSVWRKNQTRPRNFRQIVIGLEMERTELYERIDLRVENMLSRGLLQEVSSLLPYQDKPALKTVGYAELFDYLNGKYTLDTAVEKIKQHTRRYAKRQITWFKRNPDTHWFQADTAPEALIDFVRSRI